MAFECSTEHGLLRLEETTRGWLIELGAERSGFFVSADAAVAALLSGMSGLASLARHNVLDVPSDLLRWTPTAEHL